MDIHKAVCPGYAAPGGRAVAEKAEHRRIDSENLLDVFLIGLLISDHLSVPCSGTFAVEAIRTYSMQFEADLARIALERADIPALVVGASPYPGVIGGVQLLVAEDRIEEALKVLKHFEERR